MARTANMRCGRQTPKSRTALRSDVRSRGPPHMESSWHSGWCHTGAAAITPAPGSQRHEQRNKSCCPYTPKLAHACTCTDLMINAVHSMRQYSWKHARSTPSVVERRTSLKHGCDNSHRAEPAIRRHCIPREWAGRTQGNVATTVQHTTRV